MSIHRERSSNVYMTVSKKLWACYKMVISLCGWVYRMMCVPAYTCMSVAHVGSTFVYVMYMHVSHWHAHKLTLMYTKSHVYCMLIDTVFYVCMPLAWRDEHFVHMLIIFMNMCTNVRLFMQVACNIMSTSIQYTRDFVYMNVCACQWDTCMYITYTKVFSTCATDMHVCY